MSNIKKNNKSTKKNESILTYKVVKSNELVESKSDFTAMQHKIILFSLAQIKPKDTELATYTVRASDIIESANFRIISDALTILENSTIGINENGHWIDYPFVENITFNRAIKPCKISITFSKKVERFLIGLRSKYTAYTLENVINFKHNYSLRLYELCKQHQSIGYREIRIDSLRDMFNLHTKYLRYFNFENRVLNPAIAEINKYSDIFIELSDIVSTLERKITAIKFIIKENQAMLMLEQIKFFAQQKNNPIL